MSKWLTLPAEKLYPQHDQQAFLEARRRRWCKNCKKEYICIAPIIDCPTCQAKGIRLFDRLTIIAGRRYGKGLALDTPVPTPQGWKTIGTLHVGEELFDESGFPTVITAISPIRHAACYVIKFSDGQEIIADTDHQWLVWSHKFRKSIRRAKKPRLSPELKTTPQLKFEENERDAVPLCYPLQYPHKNLPIPPYTLGAWLGDGDSKSAVLTNIDQQILREIEADGFEITPLAVPMRWGIGYQPSKRNAITGTFSTNESLHSKLRAEHLLNNKHVPTLYLEAAPEQRLALLQGLLDTDGHCERKGLIEFTSTNQQLANSVMELATGFGWRPYCITDRATLYGKDCGPRWRVLFYANRPAFRLKRKLERQQLGFKKFFPVRYVTSVIEIPSVPTRCLQVDSPSSLYLVGKGCIPTHNSRIGSIAGTEESTIPNTIGWACAPTVPKLHRYVIPAFQQLIPDDWVTNWSSEFLDLRLKNGSLIHFQTLEDPDQGRGQGLDWLWVDEICELTEDHWNVLSPSLADKQGVAFFTTSPRGYDWVYDKLYHPAEEGIQGYWGLHAKTSENPIFHTDEGVAYLAREKDHLPPEMFRQEYEADFVVFTGAVYGSLLNSQILRTADEIKKIIPEWPQIDSWRQVLVGIDTGADHPFGAVKLISSEQGLVVVGEYLERHRTFAEHAGSIKMLANSPSAKYAINKNERQPMIELVQHHIICQPAENDVVAGTERVKSWLHQKQLWFVESLCPMTIKQMETYRWAPDKSKDGSVRKERVYKKNDELPDCLRYAVMTWPTLPKSLPVNTERDISKLPDETQATILRMRKIDADPTMLPKDEITGDFWS